MVTKRTPISRGKRHTITPAIILAYRDVSEIMADGDAANVQEEDGGRQREWLDACLALHHLLGRDPWQEDIMDVVTDAPPDYIARNGEANAQNPRTWAEARKLRLAIERAAK
jgi:hypothetical protein